MLLGESIRSLDDRYRLTLPPEMCEELAAEDGECLLAKEQPGCLGLWRPAQMKERLEQGRKILESKIAAGRLEGRLAEVQSLGRLLSTRHRGVQLAGRGRLVIPEGFREFLGVEPGGTVVVVGAAVCVELWRPEAWSQTIGQQMPEFGKLFEELTA
ncbi:MraZ-like protein [Posidoniimonas corsicana]|uniref:Transcriptional regulator MraZ n=1 Tax=Posidoniimonas corsicana TaxID=1938618 RepID=A0A5C5VJG0_9BACT|nr:MraZ N-terminal domain-containing protein [Posidoniimonas corsicana]TWT37945.1 MraZ-like protein [Posidoniimonas corsicana]